MNYDPRYQILHDLDQVNKFSDAKFVKSIRERIQWLNTLDKSNEEILRTAKDKGVI